MHQVPKCIQPQLCKARNYCNKYFNSMDNFLVWSKDGRTSVVQQSVQYSDNHSLGDLLENNGRFKEDKVQQLTVPQSRN